MKSIVLSITDSTESLQSALVDFLRSQAVNLTVNEKHGHAYVIVGSCANEISIGGDEPPTDTTTITLATPGADVPAIEIPPMDAPAEVGLDAIAATMGEPVVPAPITVPPADTMAMAPAVQEPAVSIPMTDTFSRECTVMSLSTECAVPTCYKPEQMFSDLLASDVVPSVDGTLISFKFCGNEYKFPIEKKDATSFGSIVCNSNPDYTNQSIRVALQFVGCTVVYPCLLKVVQKTDTEPYSIIFGKDLEEVIEYERGHDAENLPKE